MVGLAKASQQLRDSQRELNIETAKRRAEVEALKLIAEDLSIDEQTRLEAAQKAFALEDELLAMRVTNAEEALRIKQAEIDATTSSAEDLDALAQLEIDLFNIKQESGTKQIELNNKINSIKREGEAKEATAAQEAITAQEEKAAQELAILNKKNALIDEIALQRAETEQEREMLALEQQQEKAALEIENLQATQAQKDEMLLLLQESFVDKKNSIDNKYAENKKATDDAVAANQEQLDLKSIADAKAVQAAKMAGLNDGLNNVKAVFGQESAAGKAAAVLQATINTYQGASKAIAQFGVPLGIPFAALAVAAGFKQVTAITNAPTPAFASGGLVRGSGTGTSDSISARLSKGETVINARSTRMFKPMLSAMNEAGGGVGFASGGSLDTSVGGQTIGAVKAFVVTDDITDSQKGLEIIRQKATI